MGKKTRNARNGGNYDDEDERVIMGFEAVYLWVDPFVSGPLFLTVLVTLLSITYYSLLSVVAYTALFVLGAACGAKLYVYVANTFLGKNVSDPLQKFADFDPTVSEEKVQEFAGKASENLNFAVTELRRLFFVENTFDSIKFGLSLWFLTYIGCWFNAMTLLILAWVGLFTIPKVYVNNQQALDPILDQIKTQVGGVLEKVNALIPSGGSKPAKVEEKEE